MREYRLTVRLNLENQQERAVAEFLTYLDCENFGSRNRFAIAALQNYISNLDCTRSDELVERIQQVVRSELRSIPVTVQASESKPGMTQQQKTENDRSVLEALELFE